MGGQHFAVGRGSWAGCQEPSALVRFDRYQCICAPCLRSPMFPVWRFVNADQESRTAQCRRALGRGEEDGGMLMDRCLISVSEAPHCQLVWSEMESGGLRHASVLPRGR
jgi:hypothetical protein